MGPEDYKYQAEQKRAEAEKVKADAQYEAEQKRAEADSLISDAEYKANGLIQEADNLEAEARTAEANAAAAASVETTQEVGGDETAPLL